MEFLLVPIDSNLASSTPGIGVSYRPSRGLRPRPAGTVIRTEVTATTPNPRPIIRCVRDGATCPRWRRRGHRYAGDLRRSVGGPHSAGAPNCDPSHRGTSRFCSGVGRESTLDRWLTRAQSGAPSGTVRWENGRPQRLRGPHGLATVAGG